MRYAFLLYGDEMGAAALRSRECADLARRHRELAGVLGRAGALVAHGLLRPSATATTLWPASGRLIDGPSSGGQLGGVYLVDCADLDEALVVARRFPRSPGLAVEVRPVMGV